MTLLVLRLELVKARLARLKALLSITILFFSFLLFFGFSFSRETYTQHGIFYAEESRIRSAESPVERVSTC